MRSVCIAGCPDVEEPERTCHGAEMRLLCCQPTQKRTSRTVLRAKHYLVFAELEIVELVVKRGLKKADVQNSLAQRDWRRVRGNEVADNS